MMSRKIRIGSRKSRLAVIQTELVMDTIRETHPEIELELINEGEETAEVQAAYYTEPVLGVDRRFARHIKAKWENGGLFWRAGSTWRSTA